MSSLRYSEKIIMRLTRHTLLALGSAMLALSASPLAAQQELPLQVTRGFDAYIAFPDTLIPVLAGVTDKASADASAPQLRQQLEKLYELRTGLQGITSLSPAQQKLVKSRYEKQMRVRWGEVYSHIFRLQNAKCYGSAEFSQVFRLMCMMLLK